MTTVLTSRWWNKNFDELVWISVSMWFGGIYKIEL